MTAPLSFENKSAASTDVVPVSFWLLPCPTDSKWLEDVIRDLAQRYSGPVFDPHVTLHEARCARAADIEGLIGRRAARCPPLNLAALATAESDVYYRTLFIDIAMERLDGERLVELRRQLVLGMLEECGGGRDGRESAAAEQHQALSHRSFRPHLSLLYGKLSLSQRAALAAQTDYRGRSILFDRIAAVRPMAGRSDLSQVDYWEVFGHHRLTG